MSKEAKTKITQVIRQFFAKAALVITESRVVSTKVIKDPALNTPLVNKWFNLELDESEEVRESLRLWKSIDFRLRYYHRLWLWRHISTCETWGQNTISI